MELGGAAACGGRGEAPNSLGIGTRYKEMKPPQRHSRNEQELLG